jgi:hypothetical protein
MNIAKLKDLLIRSLDVDADPLEVSGKIEEAGVYYNFGENFRDRIMDKIYSTGSAVVRDIEFVKSLNYVFYRIALPGVAAILLLLISIFLMEGSLSLNSFLGMGDSYDESFVYLLTGN